jgi:hypothetical protein
MWHYADLLEECQIILKVPIVGDAAVPNTQNIRRNEVHRLPIAIVPVETPSEMPSETKMRDDAIADDQPLHDRHVKIRHRSKEAF